MAQFGMNLKNLYPRSCLSLPNPYIWTLVRSTSKFANLNDKTGKSGNATRNLLPQNLQDIHDTETVKFSPQRSRDSASARFGTIQQSSGTFSQEFMGSQGTTSGTDTQKGKFKTNSRPNDTHVDVYDANNSVSLSSVMQSTVPTPFNTRGKKAPAHLNMPGGHWAQGDKYLSGDMHDHYTQNVVRKNPVE